MTSFRPKPLFTVQINNERYSVGLLLNIIRLFSFPSQHITNFRTRIVEYTGRRHVGTLSMDWKDTECQRSKHFTPLVFKSYVFLTLTTDHVSLMINLQSVIMIINICSGFEFLQTRRVYLNPEQVFIIHFCVHPCSDRTLTHISLPPFPGSSPEVLRPSPDSSHSLGSATPEAPCLFPSLLFKSSSVFSHKTPHLSIIVTVYDDPHGITILTFNTLNRSTTFERTQHPPFHLQLLLNFSLLSPCVIHFYLINSSTKKSLRLKSVLVSRWRTSSHSVRYS